MRKNHFEICKICIYIAENFKSSFVELNSYSQIVKHMVQKKRLVISYKNCPSEVVQAIKEKYPLGYGDAIIKVQKPNGDFFHAITVDFEDVSYLVKVDVKIDNLTEEEFEKQFGSNVEDEADGAEFEAKEDENPDNIVSPESNYDE
jgi:hypothetical protein